MMNEKKILIVIVGPTAVGKTALSISLAKELNTEILSADSRQFYTEMSIGTAKPTIEEMDGIPHHFINSASLHEPYNVGKFETEGLAILQEIFNKKDVAILVGGSGLYLKAITEGLDEMPDVPDNIRWELMEIFRHRGLDVLLTELKEKDIEYYEKVDKGNPQRVVRALEVIRATGKTFSAFRKQSVKERPFKVIKIGLELPRDILYQRIDERMDLMLSQGLFEEAKELYPFKDKNALQTVGYQEIFGYLDNQYNQEEMVRLLKRNSRRYAKRQMTWFKKDISIQWFSPFQKDEILTYILEVLKN